MTSSSFLIFFVSMLMISATPGPNMLLAFQQGLNYGVRGTLWTLAGLTCGLFILLFSTLLGIDIVSRQMPWLLTLVKVVGALYLAYLGAESWRQAHKSEGLIPVNQPSAYASQASTYPSSCSSTCLHTHAFTHTSSKPLLKSPWQRFRQGVWVSLSNPKAILFFAAFFPKFIDFNAPLLPQYTWLVFGFFVSETTWQLAYTVGGTKLANWLGQGSRLLWLNRLCGVIFILIALALMGEVGADYFSHSQSPLRI